MFLLNIAPNISGLVPEILFEIKKAGSYTRLFTLKIIIYYSPRLFLKLLYSLSKVAVEGAPLSLRLL